MKDEKILAIGMALTMLFSINVIVNQAEATSPPAISFAYDDSSKTITILAVDEDLYYSDSSSGNDANLVFIRDDDQFYHYVDNNMSVTSSNPASTEEIEAGDVISGFTEGTWGIYWKPYGSGFSYMTFTVTEEEPPATLPNISFAYDDSLKKIIILAVDEGLHYSDSSSSTDANLVFVRNNETFYRYVVGGGPALCIGTYGPACTEEIEAGDSIGCFINSPGTYNIYWKPYGSGSSYMTFVVTEYNPPASPPAISFAYDDSSKTITILAVDPDLYYSDSYSSGDANLVFIRNGDQFYHYVDTNMHVTSSNPASTEEIEAGDVISGFTPGTWGIYWKPYGSGFSYMTFTVTEEGSSDLGWIYGTVMGIMNNMEMVSLDNAEVNVILGNSTVVASNYTDINGGYTVYIGPGTYSVEVSKDGFLTMGKMSVVVESGKGTRVNFKLPETGEFNRNKTGLYITNSTFIDEAIDKGNVGSEILIWQEQTNIFQHEVLTHNGVEIKELDIKRGSISFTVSGNETMGGKTIAINVDDSVFDLFSQIFVNYDGEPIDMADDIDDILDPNDDGSHPEYLISIGSNGVQILISIPHFSEHFITFFNLTPEQAAQFLTYAVVAAVGLIIIAAVVMFRKGKED